jgi:hypothetical protein
MEEMFVMDARGTTNLVPIATMSLDTAKSFKPLVPPVVMNNSSTTNNSSSSGGEGNNVSGQNFPLTAINPHIQEFLQKQNMQYQ